MSEQEGREGVITKGLQRLEEIFYLNEIGVLHLRDWDSPMQSQGSRKERKDRKLSVLEPLSLYPKQKSKQTNTNALKGMKV